MWLRERLFSQEDEIPKRRRDRKWIKILALALLLGVAWQYLGLNVVAVVIWNMLCDVAAALRDFWYYILNQRSQAP